MPFFFFSNVLLLSGISTHLFLFFTYLCLVVCELCEVKEFFSVT